MEETKGGFRDEKLIREIMSELIETEDSDGNLDGNLDPVPFCCCKTGNNVLCFETWTGKSSLIA